MATQMFCSKCKTWFLKFECCETCGFAGHGFNKWLNTAKLNAHLYGEAGRVTKEATDQAKFVRAARNEAKRVGA